ncbi:alpha-amylase family glycosyl hydrolase [Methylomicrobium sp. Wu6]|uniref:alpha-amylase family glycosyl hydrolase n=1 Tax=Methylomicrobium sp. Wu6 TaxID=3107928 RepID=UPI002DD654C2|nr:alpha-amylase family glycosyl hydrolase [Methylomicrobium sp. Wu6]MEC4748132.1 alpha-amylase family glycosyl hydrolase [Methylomicrobium sp. Wu6]
MKPWPKHPLIYEINTWVWLEELGQQSSCPISLASLPDAEWDRIASLGFDAVWLMGVWERSPVGIRISMANEGLRADFQRVLPDFKETDNVGSPYCIRRYTVDEHLGGPEALAIARAKMADRGMRLILDFVPNHVAPDHPWITQHPEYFIRGDAEDLSREPTAFIESGGNIFACGKDPYFPAWADVIQVNGFDKGLRSAVVETLIDIAGQCDGVRCDMAMLLIHSVFEKTWGPRAGPRPEVDYWRQAIPAVKEKATDFLFIAEAYWDLEWELQQQGFDYCYDKRLYDRLEHDSAESVHLHLRADRVYQDKLVRFIENHDEPWAANIFNSEKHRAVAVTALTLPGARLIHEGQMEGRRVRLPVFLGRRPEESTDTDLLGFYQQLLGALKPGDFMRGLWQLCERVGWPDNASHINLVAWSWTTESARCLIVANLSETRSQGRIKIPWAGLKDHLWRLEDVFMLTFFERDGTELENEGLYIDLPAWGFHLLIASQGNK